MELIKKNIHMNKLRCKSNLQLILDDDFNVSDTKPDIDYIITSQGEVKINEIRAMNGKLMVKGVLAFNVLYLSEQEPKPVHNLSGEIPFDEVINMDVNCSDDEPIVRWELEDLTAGLINSRKLSVKAIVGLYVTVEDLYDEETAVGVEGPEDVQCIHKKMEVTNVVINKKDTFRIKDEVVLPANKGNISSLLFSDIGLSNVEVRLMDDKFSIKGEIPLFILYTSNDEENPIEYYETELPFSGTVDCNGCTEDMIEDISFNIISKNLEIKPDVDGEDRVIDLEIILEMGIKVYDVDEPDVLYDAYCTTKELKPVIRNACYENLVIKNNSKYRISDRIRIESDQPKLLQICHAKGDIKLDEITVESNGLLVDGVIELDILYISEDDHRPLNSLRAVIPFSQLVELKGMKPDSNYEIKPSIDQLSVMMLDSDEIEAKATINLNTIVFDLITEPIISDIEVSELDMEKIRSMPGIVGYVVKKGDSLWNIAKKYYTTVSDLMVINNLEDDRIKEGDKLIILKKVEAVR